MNSRGVLMLTTASANRVFQVVKYADISLQYQLAEAAVDSTVYIRVQRIPGRASVYRAAHPTEPPTVSQDPTQSHQQPTAATETASLTELEGLTHARDDDDVDNVITDVRLRQPQGDHDD
ncbi:hypothetical protein DP106_13735 [Halonotius pteroides]|uniref:DUF7999 domain-containing protein n=1 Tax=Halonotius pteroides TaxID=268735 RepID=A0A3A6Q6D6_9EURY|nr:hypothetical protein DP106_13735 [Halonotius pteroides]